MNWFPDIEEMDCTLGQISLRRVFAARSPQSLRRILPKDPQEPEGQCVIPRPPAGPRTPGCGSSASFVMNPVL